MWQGLFLILILFSLTAFAQTQEKKESYKVIEYQKIRDKLLKEKIYSLCEESIRTESVGWIINYGTSKENVVRVKQISKTYSCRQEFPESRIIVVDGGKNGKSRTEFWIVPPNAKPPIPTPKN